MFLCAQNMYITIFTILPEWKPRSQLEICSFKKIFHPTTPFFSSLWANTNVELTPMTIRKSKWKSSKNEKHFRTKFYWCMAVFRFNAGILSLVRFKQNAAHLKRFKGMQCIFFFNSADWSYHSKAPFTHKRLELPRFCLRFQNCSKTQGAFAVPFYLNGTSNAMQFYHDFYVKNSSMHVSQNKSRHFAWRDALRMILFVWLQCDLSCDNHGRIAPLWKCIPIQIANVWMMPKGRITQEP